MVKLVAKDGKKPKAKLKSKVQKQKKPEKKRKHEDVDHSSDDDIPPLKETRMSDEPIPKKWKWLNKQRVLMLSSRGINFRDRHLMKDLRTLMPHHRLEPKMERWKTLSIIDEIAQSKHCSKMVFFEGRRKRDLYLWMANVQTGPSVKFLIENIHTMGELNLTGNCLRASRPLLSFDQEFSKHPHLEVIKELLVQIFGVPHHHPKSQPFIDRIVTFTYIDSRIWYRHFQILTEDGGLVEVGPRFVMNPIKIFDGSFRGETLWENPMYQSPSRHRQLLRKAAQDKYVSKQRQKTEKDAHEPLPTYESDPHKDVFQGEAEETAKKILAKEGQRAAKEKERQLMEAQHKKEQQKHEIWKLKMSAKQTLQAKKKRKNQPTAAPNGVPRTKGKKKNKIRRKPASDEDSD